MTRALENLISLNVLKEYIMETETVTELRKIRADLDMLTNLYAKLIDRLIPEEEPEAQDIKAIRGKDKIASESELLKVLDV
jgi:hypothetical protein